MIDLKHGTESLKIKLAKYGDGSLAIQLVDLYGSPYVTLSTNIENSLQDNEHIFIKDYDAHAEIAESMVQLGLLILTDKRGTSGYNNYCLYKVTDLLFQNSEKM